MEPLVLAKEAEGKSFSDFVEACEHHFNTNYPECVNTNHHKTVMCPPVFPFCYVAPTGDASGAVKPSPMEENTIRGDTAELKIFHQLEKFGQKHEQSMFVLTQLKLSEFSKTLLKQKLAANHPILAKDFNGEIDFVIIHRKIGVILIEVKANSKFTKSLQGNAREQLERGEDIILSLLEADGKPEIDVPVYKVIALPNVSELCRGNSTLIGLREFDVRSDGNFRDWWRMNFREVRFDTGRQEKLQNLLSICVCERSVVNSEVLSRVFKKIDEQSFLEQIYEKGDEGCEVVSKTDKEPEQAILSKQVLFLNSEQLRIWNSGPHTIFNGISGREKTILLEFRALECAKAAQQKVVVVVPMPLIALYVDFFSRNGISMQAVDVLSPVDFFDGRYFKSDATSRFHFFADELQAFQTDIPDLSSQLEKVMAIFVKSECYCWIAYDYMQMNENTSSQDETGGLSSGAKLQTEARNLCKTYGFHHASCLKTVVRSTFEIYEYVQGYVEESLERELQRALPLEHIDEKKKRTLIEFVGRYGKSNYLGHHICGPQVVEYEHSELGDIVRTITSEISEWTTKKTCHRDIAILVTSHYLKEKLSQLMTMEEIPVCDVGQQTSEVVLDYGYKARSYEWKFVIAVSCTQDQCLLADYTMMTRAVTRLVVIRKIYSP